VPEEARALVRLVHASPSAEGKRNLEERVVNGLLAASEFQEQAD